ncbi:dual specificity protein phosphatase 1-like [Acanthaster planci]|uniref:protein-tyrosine-phosphatase n=1 Tax=Acanthaster planci TaxID=133434 RepID=A0A8B7YYC4_ACAPL|nr:dual specificity protein phosphatase 1-like [Acanthaster planci]
MTVSVHVRPISTNNLRDVLAGEPGDTRRVLLVDSRPFIQFNDNHIGGAHNIHCPRLLRRRSKGALAMDYIVTCPETRAELLAGLFSTVVVYDERTKEIGDSTARDNSDLVLVLESLLQAPVCHLTTEITFLQGGFEKFCQEHPSMCSASAARAPMDTEEPIPVAGPVGPSLRLQRLTRCATVPLAAPPSASSSGCGGDASSVPARTVPLHQEGEPVQILPHLYLGNAFHAARRDLLEAHGITAVLNVSRCVPNYFLSEGAIAYKSIPVDDDNEADLLSWFPEAIDFIDTVKLSGGSVLIHCRAGISRSATVCLAYLMKVQAMRLEEAFEFVRSLRKVISPNFSFMLQLLRYEADLKQQREATSSGSGGGVGAGCPAGPGHLPGRDCHTPHDFTRTLPALFPGARRTRSASLPCLVPASSSEKPRHQVPQPKCPSVFNFAIAPPCGWQQPDHTKGAKPICSPS